MGDSFTRHAVDAPAPGDVVFNEFGTFTYTPDLNFFGSDSFTYRANDGELNSNVGTITINIAPVNDAPVASNAVEIAEEDGMLFGRVTVFDVEGDGSTSSW